MAAPDADLPPFDELPMIEALGLRHAWGTWGDDDDLGTINLLTPQRVLVAAGEIRTGETISLDLPLNLPDPPLFDRAAYRHEIYTLSRNEMDDRLDSFHPQLSTQWDALSHIRCREFGFWNGRPDNPTTDDNELGIDKYAEHGIVGRAVLVDVAHAVDDPMTPTEIPITVVQEALDAQGSELRDGDILCLRTGWVGAYKALDQAGRQRVAEVRGYCGLRGDEDTARFLWDHHLAAVCADNPAIEVVPGDAWVGSLHRRIMPLLGFAIGEMFDFEELARRSREDGRWSFFFVAVPLKIPGGVGSPGNAVAIR